VPQVVGNGPTHIVSEEHRPRGAAHAELAVPEDPCLPSPGVCPSQSPNAPPRTLLLEWHLALLRLGLPPTLLLLQLLLLLLQLLLLLHVLLLEELKV